MDLASEWYSMSYYQRSFPPWVATQRNASPTAREGLQTCGSPPPFLKAFPGPRGLPNHKNAAQQIRPDCIQVPSIKTEIYINFQIWFRSHLSSRLASNWLWHGDRIKSLLQDRRAWCLDTHLCQYGTPWRKSTRLLIWGPPCDAFQLLKCRGPRRGICSESGEAHIQLRGLTGAGKFCTSLAQVYPKPFAASLCSKLEPYV